MRVLVVNYGLIWGIDPRAYNLFRILFGRILVIASIILFVFAILRQDLRIGLLEILLILFFTHFCFF